jgi:hypothetical protein
MHSVAIGCPLLRNACVEPGPFLSFWAVACSADASSSRSAAPVTLSDVFFFFFSFFFFLFLFNGIGVETQGFVLARQAPNCLSHCVSPFGSGCFAQRLSLFAQASLDLDLPF